MKVDFSQKIFEKYFQLTNRIIEVKLKDGKFVKGFIIGFFVNPDENLKTQIVKWHLVPGEEMVELGFDSFGVFLGTIIKSEDVMEIKFMADNSILKRET